MTFLPIVERELRAASRRWQTYWVRFFTALLTLTICVWFWGAITDSVPAHQRALIVFHVVSGLAMTYCLLAGIGITADSLSEEKRAGTLGLLFLTDLKGYDIVFGKLAATSLGAVYWLLSLFPILSIPLLLGAMTLGEIGRMVLVMVSTLLFSLAAGMLVSAVCQSARKAMAWTILLIFFVTAVPPAIGVGIAMRIKALQPNSNWLAPQPDSNWFMSSAIYPAVLASDAQYQRNSTHFWAALGVTQGLAACFLALSSVLIRHRWQDRPAAGPSSPWRMRLRNWKYGNELSRQIRRRRLLDTNPVLWLSGRNQLRVLYIFGALGALGFVWLSLYWWLGRDMLDPTVCILVSYAAHTLIKIWLASEACRLLGEDRGTGALELLLSTPLTIKEILEGEVLALRRQFSGAVGVILLADVFLLLAGGVDQGLPSDWLFFCLGLMVMFVADLFTLAWVGLWLGLTAKRTHRALSGTINRVLILPWVLFTLGMTALATGPWRNFQPGEMGVLGGAFALALTIDIICFLWAEQNLRSHFRLVATQRFDSKLGWLKAVTEAPAPSRPIPPPP